MRFWAQSVFAVLRRHFFRVLLGTECFCRALAALADAAPPERVAESQSLPQLPQQRAAAAVAALQERVVVDGRVRRHSSTEG